MASGEANDGSYVWTTPDVNSGRCLIMVEAENTLEAIGYNISRGYFAIGDTFVTNLRTGRIYIEIEEALTTSETIAGDTLLCDPGIFYENGITCYEMISLQGSNQSPDPSLFQPPPEFRD